MSDIAPITLEYDHLGNTDGRIVLAAFADDVPINVVYGPDRRSVAASLTAHLLGIMPTESDVVRAAWGYGNPRRLRAYRNGRKHVMTNYSGYGLELPER